MRMIQTSTVNWGHLPIGDVEFGSVTFLGGETGAGKSSFMDAVVAVMTGNETRFARYNSAQTETRQSRRTKRSIGTYVLGMDDTGPPMRQEGGHGYAAVYWEPDALDKGKGRAFTAIIGAEVSAERQGSEISPKVLNEYRIIVEGKVSAADFLDLSEGFEQVISCRTIVKALKAKFGNAAVRDFSKKEEYVCRLYAMLKDSPTPVDRKEADSSMRAFVNSIAYRPVEDLDALIREEILEVDEDIDGMIHSMRSAIQETANLRQQADRLALNIESLEGIQEDISLTTKHLTSEWMNDAWHAAKELLDAVKRRDDDNGKADDKQQQLDDIVSKISTCERIVSNRTESLNRLKASINGNGVFLTRQALQSKIVEAQATETRFAETLKNAAMSLSAARALLMQAVSPIGRTPELESAGERLSIVLNAMSEVDLPAVQAHFQAVVTAQGGEKAVNQLSAGIERIDDAIGRGWSALVRGETSIVHQMDHARDALRTKASEANARLKVLEARQSALSSGKVYYPRDIADFHALVLDKLPQSNPRFLCDVVEMSDPSWQNAIEGYLGGNRFSLIYDPDYEVEILGLLEDYTEATKRKPSVPQIGEAIKSSSAVEPGSVIEKLKSQDATAMAYLRALYGRTICVATKAELKHRRSGVMKNGLSTAAFKYQDRSANDSELVFGIEVRRQQAVKLKEEIEKAVVEANEITSKEKALRDVGNKLRDISGVDLSDMNVADLVAASAESRKLVLELSQLDTSSIEEIEQSIEDDTIGIEEAEEEKKEHLILSGKLASEIDALRLSAAEQEENISKLTPEADRRRKTFEDLIALYPEIKRSTFAAVFNREPVAERQIRTFTENRSDNRTFAVRSKGELLAALREYNQDAAEHQKIVYADILYPIPRPHAFGEWLMDLEQKVHRQLTKQRDTGLVECQQNLLIAEQQFSTAFTTNFCSRVLGKVEGGDETYEQINEALSNIEFSGDRLTMSKTTKDEYAEYIDLFKAIRTQAAYDPTDLFGTETSLTAAQQETLADIKKLLLSSDAERSMKELGRIADHRNYKKYDFIRTAKGGDGKSMSTWGTGSGGESETPFYIIRAAVFAASFRHFGKQASSHFRTMILDEVFQKMDEARTRRVMRFLTEEMGFQIICAAPTKSMAAVLDEFDRRISFAKSADKGSQTWIQTTDINQERFREIYREHRKATEAKVIEKFEDESLVVAAE